jgi:hypothetical protein
MRSGFGLPVSELQLELHMNNVNWARPKVADLGEKHIKLFAKDSEIFLASAMNTIFVRSSVVTCCRSWLTTAMTLTTEPRKGI